MSRVVIDYLGTEPELTTVGDARVVWTVSGYEQEYAALRSGSGLADFSGCGPLRVSGPGAVDALNRALTRDVAFLTPEQAQTSLVLAPDGRPIDVVVVLAIAQDDYYLHCGPGRDGQVAEALRAVVDDEAVIENLRESVSVFAVEGPRAWRTIGAVLGEDYVSLAYESLLPAEVNDEEVLIARVGVTGEYGYTLFVPEPVAADLWRALAEHSTLVGYRALETAMLEVRQPIIHRELEDGGTVLTAGLNWLVDLSKTDFVGRDAMLAQRHAPGRRPIGFGVASGQVGTGDDLFVGTEYVGRVGHVVDSPGFGGQLGLALVDRQWQAARLEFCTASGAQVRTLAAPYVTPKSWNTPIEG